MSAQASDKKPPTPHSPLPTPHSPGASGTQGYTLAIDQAELDEIYRAIQARIRTQRSKQSSLKSSMLESAAPRKNSRTLPLMMIIPSTLIALVSLFLLLERFTEIQILSRLFSNLRDTSEAPSNVNKNQVIRRIQDEAQQQIADLQITLLNQQRTLEYVEVERERIVADTNDAQQQRNAEELQRNAEELQRSAEELQRGQEALQAAVQQQRQLESEFSQLESQAARSFLDYNELAVQQERLDLLLNQYLSLTNNIRDAVQANNSGAVEREVERLRNYLNTFSASEGGILQPLFLSGGNFITTADAYLEALRTSARLGEAEETTAAADTTAAPEGGDASLGARVEVGAAVRIGNASRFGVSEGYPRDLAAIGDTLYMVGYINEALYTLDTATGVATRVGTANRFGVGEREPEGLAAIGDTLYMVGETKNALYTLDTATGVATRVRNVFQFGVRENEPGGLAAIGGTLYMVGGTYNTALYTLDTTTGRATQVGTTVASFGVGAGNPSGLAAIGSTLYMVDFGDKALYTLNTTTGRATRVRNVHNFGVSEYYPKGLAAIGSILYMVGSGNAVLYALRYQ